MKVRQQKIGEGFIDTVRASWFIHPWVFHNIEKESRIIIVSKKHSLQQERTILFQKVQSKRFQTLFLRNKK